MAIINTEKLKLDGGAILANNASNDKLKVSYDAGVNFTVMADADDVSAESTSRKSMSSSVDTAVKAESTQRDTDVKGASTARSTLEAKDATLSNARLSLSTSLSTSIADIDGESEVGTEAVSNNVNFHAITFSQTFSTAPKVMGMLKNSEGDPIIAVQLSGVSTTGATFIFSDETPSADYNLDFIASL